MVVPFSDYDFSNVYLDDIIIHSKSLDYHFEHVATISKVLFKNGVKVNIEKSVFCNQEVKYLGRIISKEKIKIDPSIIKNFKIFEIPTTKRNLQSFNLLYKLV
ncbi:Retrovirus-related Pol polyprotein from transposon 17.6 [Dictyocoela muelleri]|nr:Retrovirus-related Pol polyprotein from transposon 17.6 [Dictyocoela muelleri]